jgi:hypothetical protein
MPWIGKAMMMKASATEMHGKRFSISQGRATLKNVIVTGEQQLHWEGAWVIEKSFGSSGHPRRLGSRKWRSQRSPWHR